MYTTRNDPCCACFLFYSMFFSSLSQQGLAPKFVLVTNPNNPLGVIYSKKVMLRIIKWARRRNLHTVVDELYALGTFQVRMIIQVNC